MKIFEWISSYPLLLLLGLTLCIFCVVWLIWHFSKLPKSGGYIAAAVLPLLWLLAPMILANVGTLPSPWQQMFYSLQGNVAAWYMLPLTLLFLIFMLFLNYGIEDRSYEDIFKPRKLVWTIFGLFVFFLLWFVPYTLLSAGANFDGKHAGLADIVDAVEDLTWYSYGLDSPTPTTQQTAANNLVEQAGALKSSLVSLETTMFDKETGENLRVAASQMMTLTTAIETQSKVVQSANGLVEADKWLIEEIRDKTRALESAVTVLKFERMTPFLMLSLLFAVFLLMPWLLYISFIISKREEVANDRRDLLIDLNLLGRVREAAATSKDPTVQGAILARELVESTRTIRCVDIPQNASYYAASIAFKKLCDLAAIKPSIPTDKKDLQLAQLRLAKPENVEITQKQQQAIMRQADTEIITRQTFHSREYLIPLIILSMLTLIGWYYVIFPRGANGLVNLIEQGSSTTEVTRLITRWFTPFTMAFAGAWLFMVVMLTYRWVMNDLYPRSYFYASMRLVYGFLVGLVFSSLYNFPVESSNPWLLIPAFLVGMAPLEFVRALQQGYKEWSNNKIDVQASVVKYFEQPRWASRQPLTNLEDITVWDDTRFDQEGIQNIHALATSDLARLALRTPYDASRLVDWVDQALLHIHAKVLWQPGLAALGIRSATDLFDACSDKHDRRKTAKVTRLVEAFNAAQLMSIGKDDARFAAYNAAGELESAAKTLAEQAKVLKAANEKLDPGDAETLDNLKALQQQVSKLKAKVESVENARQAVRDIQIEIEQGKVWKDDADLDKQLKALTAGTTDGLLTQAETAINKVTRTLLEEDLAKEEDADKPGQKVLKTAQDALQALVAPSDKLKTAVESALQKLKDAFKSKIDPLQEQIDALVAKAATAKEQGQALTKDTADATITMLNAMLKAAQTTETTAEQLIATVEAEGEPLKLVKEKAINLKTAVGKDKVQQTIAAAKTKVEAVKSNATVGSTVITAAQTAIQQIVTEVGLSTATATDPTIAGQMKAIAAVELVTKIISATTKAEEAKTHSTELFTAVDAANTLAQSITKDDATTWDNVKALVKNLCEFKQAIADVEEKRDTLGTTLDKLSAQDTLALREARKKVEELSFTDTKEKVETADTAFKMKTAAANDEAELASCESELSADSPESDLNKAQKTVEPATTAGETLSSDTVAVATEAMQTALPLQLTEGILEIMLDAMAHDPNTCYIRHYWQAQLDKSKQDN